MPMTRSPDAPIGVYDSGVGGLSVLRHIRAQYPNEHLIYFADSGHAPYGDKTEDYVVARALIVTDFLLKQGMKALVVACNTATVAAIKAVRAKHPELPVVGVEPGLKPAAAITRSRKVGVLATARTLKGEKFLQLREQIAAATQTEFLLQPAVGLVDQIELGDLHTPAIAALLDKYVTPLLDQGADTLVLGCTHYPFVQDGIERVIRDHASSGVTLIDTGDAVARQLGRLLEAAGLLRPAGGDAATLHGYTTADVSALAPAFANLLGLTPPVEKIDV
ncbi:glutamate racemase [Duganella sp. CY15W]|uniref:glutamate racemase n=1 Tax=Duganella sp. CY15W TaxID=2692172 RepID=UPI00136F8D26|nr:glutamate racemase [Duganella sp. CY15W]MYM32080.1 glutamate racemase [Duganella sp. CY15W]